MKTNRLLVWFILFGIFSSCSSKENPIDDNNNNPSGGENNPKELTITGTASNVTEFSAVLTGYANPTTDMGNVTVGILYSKEKEPSLQNGQQLISNELDRDNRYSVNAVDLSSNTTYYYRSFIKYGGLYRYGDTKSFNTLKVTATVETLTTTNVTEFSITLNGKVLLNGEEDLLKEAKFIYGENTSSLDDLLKSGESVTATVDNNGLFHSTVSGLKYASKYYYVAVAKVHDVVLYGEVCPTETKNINAKVECLETESITETKASLNGVLLIDSEESLTKDVWFLLSEESETIEKLKNSSTKLPSHINEDGKFTYNLKELEPGKKYYFASVAKVQDEIFYSDVNSFSTLPIEVSFDSNIKDITEISAVLEGTITCETVEELPIRIVMKYSSTKQEIETLEKSENSVDINLGTNNKFSVNIESLEPNTTYYYVIKAAVHNDVFYSTLSSFSTRAIDISVVTNEAQDVGYIQATLTGKVIDNCVASFTKEVGFSYWSSDKNESQAKTANAVLKDDGSFQMSIDDLELDTQYTYRAFTKVNNTIVSGDSRSFSTKKVPEGAVNMGLTKTNTDGSKTIVFWAYSNLGATKPEDGGDYYAWGETETKNNYNWDTYKWGNSRETLTKYNVKKENGVVDNITILEPGDDAAHVVLKGNWRIPTKEEWEQLLKECEWTWTTRNDVKGYEVKSKTTNNSIFLPAAGYMCFLGQLDYGTYGTYWSSSLDTIRPAYAWYLCMYVDNKWVTYNPRTDGRTIRAVYVE